MGAASLVFGILSLVFALFIPSLKWLGAIIGLIGIILGAVGRQDPAKKGLATGGLVCSIIGFVLCIIFAIACAAVVGSVASLGSSY